MYSEGEGCGSMFFVELPIFETLNSATHDSADLTESTHELIPNNGKIQISSFLKSHDLIYCRIGAIPRSKSTGGR